MKCIICSQNLNNENHFLCYNHFKNNLEFLTNFNLTDKEINIKEFKNIFSSILLLANNNEIFDAKEIIEKYNNFFNEENNNINEELERLRKKIRKYKEYTSSKNVYLTNDYNFVKSKDEQKIANILAKNNIKYEYETKLKKFGSKKNYKTDFYLIDYNIFFEHWGKSDSKYIENKEEKIKEYKRLKLKLISTDSIDLNETEKDLEELILRKIKEIN